MIFKELVYGAVKEKSRNYLVSVIHRLRSEGRDAIVLGCTELPYNP